MDRVTRSSGRPRRDAGAPLPDGARALSGGRAPRPTRSPSGHAPILREAADRAQSLGGYGPQRSVLRAALELWPAEDPRPAAAAVQVRELVNRPRVDFARTWACWRKLVTRSSRRRSRHCGGGGGPARRSVLAPRRARPGVRVLAAPRPWSKDVRRRPFEGARPEQRLSLPDAGRRPRGRDQPRPRAARHGRGARRERGAPRARAEQHR